MINTLDDFMRRERAQKWLVEGLIGDGELAMLFGESGVGKSFCALDLALCVATGQPWLGRSVAQGPVVYLPSEGFDGIQARIKAWFAHRQISSDGVPLHIGAYEFALNDESDFGELDSELSRMRPKPKLIVIDTLTGMTSSFDQNSQKDMAEFADTCKMMKSETGAAVLVVHHSGHKDKGRSKGAVDFWAACDRVLGLSRASRDGALSIRCAKSRNAAPFDDIHVRLQPYPPTAVLVEAKAPAKVPASTLTEGDRIFREVVRGAPIAEAEARAAFYERYGKTAGANRNAWARAFEKAVSADEIEVTADRVISQRAHSAQTQ